MLKCQKKNPFFRAKHLFHCALALDAWRTNKVNSSPRRSLRVAELVVVVRILFEAQGWRKVLKTGGAQ